VQEGVAGIAALVVMYALTFVVPFDKDEAPTAVAAMPDSRHVVDYATGIYVGFCLLAGQLLAIGGSLRRRRR
jgi:hypothetical protein